MTPAVRSLLLGGRRLINPLSLSPALWLDASDAATLWQERTGASATTPAAADADSVGSWLDKSGNGRHLTASADSKRPVLKLAIRNGRSVVRFDGVDDVLATASGPASASMTLLLVARKTTAAAAGSKSLFSWSTSSADIYQDTNQSSGWIWYSTESSGTLPIGGVPGSFNQITMDFASAAACTPYLNGTAGATFDPSSAYISAIVSLCRGGVLDADWCELLICPRLSSTDRVAAERYLKSRWGTT